MLYFELPPGDSCQMRFLFFVNKTHSEDIRGT